MSGLHTVHALYSDCVHSLLEAVGRDEGSKQKWMYILDYGYIPDGSDSLTTPFCELIKYMPGNNISTYFWLSYATNSILILSDLADRVLSKCAKFDRHFIANPKLKIEFDFMLLNGPITK